LGCKAVARLVEGPHLKARLSLVRILEALGAKDVYSFQGGCWLLFLRVELADVIFHERALGCKVVAMLVEGTPLKARLSKYLVRILEALVAKGLRSFEDGRWVRLLSLAIYQAVSI